MKKAAVANHHPQASEIVHPCDRPLDNPAASIAHQIPPLLIGGVGMVALARNHLQAELQIGRLPLRDSGLGHPLSAPPTSLVDHRGYKTPEGSAKGWTDYLGFRIAGEALAA